MTTLIELFKMSFFVLSTIFVLFLAFKTGVLKQEFKEQQLNTKRVCSYCMPLGQVYPDSLEISRNEYRVRCGEGDGLRIGVLGR